MPTARNASNEPEPDIAVLAKPARFKHCVSFDNELVVQRRAVLSA
jgi:hypothetical protein